MKTKIYVLAGLALTLSFQSCDKKQGCMTPTACNYDSTAEEDDGSCTEAQLWYQDLDGDGKGNPNVSQSSCTQPEGYVSDSSDNGDANVSISASTQRALILYVGATWCPPCGEWGGPLLDYVNTTHTNSKAINLALQAGDEITPNGDFGDSFGGDIQSDHGNSGIPRIYARGAGYAEDRGMYGSHTSNQNAIDGDISTITNTSPNVAVGATASISGNTITVTSKVRFINSSSTEHYISAYLLEDGVIADQKTGSVSAPVQEYDVNHDDIVRANESGVSSYLGTSLGTAFESGEEISKNHTITVPSMPSGYAAINNTNLRVVVVVWKGNGYDAENAVSTTIN